MGCVQEENIVFVKVDTFVGVGVGAIHYYGNLKQLVGGERVDVTHNLTQIEADRLNKGWLTKEMRESPESGYQKGEESTRFFSREAVIIAARKQFKQHFPKATVLVLGDVCYYDPQKILVGPREFKTEINLLVREYDKLDWDIRSDRPAIRKLEKKWQKLWPRKYRVL